MCKAHLLIPEDQENSMYSWLTFFDPDNNSAAILGMIYFGEHKKGTLTLAWGIANRFGYAAYG